jgi:hypothetical protein
MQGSHSTVRTTRCTKTSPSDQRLMFKLLRLDYRTFLKKGVLLGFLASLSLFSACEWPVGKITPLREPPLVPSPPDAVTQAKAQQAAHAASYADTEDIRNFSPVLAEAVAHALSLDVLKPATPESRFEPDRPIPYGEFRQWANDYQNAINNAANAPAKSQAPSSDIPSPAAGPLTPPPTLTAVTQTWLPAEMMWGGSGVREQSILTRESLCALAVFLNGQDARARKLTPSQIAQAQPGLMQSPAEDDTPSLDGGLGQLSDYSKISPWALKYVALSYQNDWLEPVFGLNPAKVIAADGFHPTQPVSRGEALLLLDLLFGKKEAAIAPNGQASDSGATTNAAAKAHALGKSQSPLDGADFKPLQTGNRSSLSQPNPVKSLQSVQETGPQGSRQAIRISGPD